MKHAGCIQGPVSPTNRRTRIGRDRRPRGNPSSIGRRRCSDLTWRYASSRTTNQPAPLSSALLTGESGRARDRFVWQDPGEPAFGASAAYSLASSYSGPVTTVLERPGVTTIDRRAA